MEISRSTSSSTGWSARVRLWSWGAVQVLRHGRPTVVFAHYGGIGDALMMARALHEWRRRQHRRTNVWVLTEFPALFMHNRDCDHALRFSPEAERMLRRLGTPIRWLHYSTRNAATDRDSPPDGHLIATMCRLAGVNGQIELTPRLVLTNRELAFGRAARGAICIQSTTSNARFPIATKEWGPARFAEVIARLCVGGHRLIQLGSVGDAPLPGAEDWRGKTTIRQTAALLAGSRLFVGLVGGLMHLARAVDCPAVIIYGGRESPAQSGYTANRNITREPPCSPCWLASRCEHEFICMHAIRPEEVVAAITKALGEPRPRRLPLDHALIADAVATL